MGKGVVFVCLLAAVAMFGASSSTASATTAAAPSAAAPIIVPAGSAKWEPLQGYAGVEQAILSGDPSQAGSQYAERLKLADGVKFPPHTHPQSEQVTVLSGTLLVGVGKTMDPSKMVALPAGSYVWVPANVPHYAAAKGETIIEIHGVGPDTIDMVK